LAATPCYPPEPAVTPTLIEAFVSIHLQMQGRDGA